MAGKGRGIAAFTFNVEALGLSRGNMPEARVGPSPLFPTTEFKPIPLKDGEDVEYMMALKQEMRGTMLRLPYNIKLQSNTTDVEKYTDKYMKRKQMNDEEWTPDWNLFPKELKPQSKKPRPKKSTKKNAKIPSKAAAEVLNKLDELAKKDDTNPDKSDDETEKKKDDEEGEIEEEEYEEEDLEEDNDYIESYFDNGEDFGANSDDNMDGEATY